LLARRPAIAVEKRRVGKEANELERIEAGLVNEIGKVLTVYEKNRAEERREVLLGLTIKEGMAHTGLSRRQVLCLRSGRRR
jgi:hypothetical protein